VHGAAEHTRTCLDDIYMAVGKMEGAYNGVHKRAKRLLNEVERLNLAGSAPPALLYPGLTSLLSITLSLAPYYSLSCDTTACSRTHMHT
jgi:hypothetical protein